MATPPPCGLSFDVASRLCQNSRGICEALDANGNPCEQQLAVHPREALTPVPSQAQVPHLYLVVTEQVKRMVSQEAKAAIGVKNATTNATIIKDWRDQHELTHQPNFDQELQLLGDETGWIEAGTTIMTTKDINVNGEVFRCPVDWTVTEARDEIRSSFALHGGRINHNNVPVRATDLISSFIGTLVFVGGRSIQQQSSLQAQVMEQLKRMVSQEVRAAIGVKNATTNATIIKDWRDQHVLTHQPNFDQELQLLGDETGWIEAGTISDVTLLSLNSLIAGPSEGEDVELVGTQAKFTNMLETIKKPDTKLYPPNKQNTGFNKTGAVSLQSKLRCNPTDAHMNPSFQNCKPDSVIYKLNGGGALDIEAIGDNKPSVKSDQSNFSDQEIAHILDMSQVLMTEIQPWRPFCISFLTDTRRFQFFKITRIKDSLSYMESRTFIGLTGWRILLGLMLQPHHFFGYEEICIADTVIDDILGIGGFGKYVFASKYKLEEDRVIKLFPSAASRDKELHNLTSLNPLRSTAYATQIPAIIAEDIISSTGRHGLVLAPLCYPVQPCTGGCDVRGSDIAQLVELLQAVHGLGLCHRDIKPSNIFKRKDTGQIFLNDWGSTASSYIPVPWEGTVGFYDMVEGNHIPHPNEDLIALSRSAYLMLYNVDSSIPQDKNEIDLFWRNKMTGSSRLWDEITVRSQQGNYARLMELFLLLK